MVTAQRRAQALARRSDPPDNLGIFTCRHVCDEGAPIQLVTHDMDGDWQFLCRADHAEAGADDIRLLSLAEIVKCDAAVKPLLRMCAGWEAWRETPQAEWQFFDGMENHIRDSIENYGWHVISVTEDEEGPGFAYSIGLRQSFGHPELILFGLPTETLHQILNLAGEAIKAGARYEAGGRTSDLVEGFDCVLKPMAPAHYPAYLGYARWYYAGDEFPVLQIVWPDKEGFFPWEPEFNPKLRDLQPLLDRG